MIKGSIHWEHRTEDMILLGRHGYTEAKYNSKTVSAKSKHATPQANNSSPGYTPKRKEYIHTYLLASPPESQTALDYRKQCHDDPLAP